MMLLHGDCLIELEKVEPTSIDLIYLDPPFFTQKSQTLKTRDNSKEYSFDDTWEDINSYQTYIKERLEKCKTVLKDTGSIFLHCDRSASHYLRIALDEIFGPENFQSEIVWSYKRWSNAKKGLLNAHQIIFFYSKTNNFKFSIIYTDYSPTTNLDQIFQKRVRDENGKTIYKKGEDGNLELMEEKKGVPLSDVWEIPFLNPKAKERVGYPTQKPIILLERMIKLVTNEGDTVLDPFCGSGTTLVASQFLGRRYIGIDKSQDAIELAKKRLEKPIKSESDLLKNGKGAYLNQDPKVLEVLERLDIIPVQRNKGIDGFLKNKNFFRPIPVKVQKDDESIEVARNLLLHACQKTGYQKKILIKTNDRQIEQLVFFCNEDEGRDKDLIIVDDIENFLNERGKLLNL
ncbi:MAG: site-specific DNA-methyltransferase [bacterium]